MRLFLFLNLIVILNLPLFLSAQNRLAGEIEIRKIYSEISDVNVINKTFTRNDAIQSGIHVEGDALFFRPASGVIDEIIDKQPDLVRMKIPYGTEGKELTVIMYNKKPYKKSAIVTTNTGEKYAMNKAAFYRGKVIGEDNSIVALSFFKDEMSGVISSQEGQFDLGKADKGDMHVIYKASSLAYKYNFKCGVMDTDESPDTDSDQLEQRDANDCVNIYFETSYSIFQNKGSVSAVQNYVNGFFNVVSTLYDNEDVNVAISEINVWTTQDPFPTNSSGDALDFYTDYRTSFNGNIAQLLAKTNNGNGGVAWLNVLCNNTYKHSYSDISMSYSNFPNYSWTVEVVTHELGHNIGSPHTHWCGWPGGAIDNCYTPEGSCNPGPAPTNGGTIMSYCHLTSYGINFSNGFGPLPGDKIRNKVASANCLSDCVGQCPTFVLTASIQNVTCNGNNNGQIILNEPTEGTPPYSYTWSNGATTKDILNLTAGTYTVSIVDAAGCPGEASFTVDQPSPVTIQGTVTPVTCYGMSNGVIIANANGGTPGYNYHWNTGVNSSTLTNIPAGVYSLTVTDANQCAEVSTFTVTQPDLLFITEEVSQISCAGANNGSIYVSGNGGTPGYFYLWENGSTDQVRTVLGPGDYVVTVTDANNCQETKTITIVEPTPLVGQVVTTKTTNPNASDGTAEANINGGSPNYSYSWSNGASGKKITGLAVGNYSVTVTDDHGCQLILSFSIESEECVLEVGTTKTDLTCAGANDGVAIANVGNHSGTYTYNWSTGATSQTISGLAAGTYTVTVTDAICNVVKSVEIKSPTAISVTPDFEFPTCDDSNGSISLTVSGGNPGYNYIWSNGATTQSIENIGAGTYTVTITDSHQCVKAQTYVLNSVDNQPPVATNTNLTIYLDDNGLADLNWVLPSDLFTDNCSLASLVLDKLTFDCSNLGQVSVIATGTDNAGNFTQSVLNVTVKDTIAPQITCPDSFTHGICQGAPFWDEPVTSDNCLVASTTQTEGYTKGTVFPIGVTIVAYEVTDQSGNKNTCSFNITVTEGLSVKLSTQNMLCNNVNNGSAKVDTIGLVQPYTILWSTGATTSSINNLGEGTYSVTISDGNGCTSSDTFNITNPAPIVLELISVTDATSEQANDGTINISVTGGTPEYTYEWTKNGEVISTEQDPDNLAPGVYQVKVKDKNGCVLIGNEITVSVKLGVSGWSKSPITVYPNPTDDNVVIRSDDIINSKITIYNILGKVEQTLQTTNERSVQVKTDMLVCGTYILKVENGDQWYVTKLIVKH